MRIAKPSLKAYRPYFRLVDDIGECVGEQTIHTSLREMRAHELMQRGQPEAARALRSCQPPCTIELQGAGVLLDYSSLYKLWLDACREEGDEIVASALHEARVFYLFEDDDPDDAGDSAQDSNHSNAGDSFKVVAFMPHRIEVNGGSVVFNAAGCQFSSDSRHHTGPKPEPSVPAEHGPTQIDLQDEEDD